MSILTHKMKTARKDYFGSNCKFFMPMNEGTGTTVTDLASGVACTSASIAHDTPHAISGNISISDQSAGTVPQLTGAHLLMYCVGIPITNAAFFTWALGKATTGFNPSLSGSVGSINSPAGAAVTAAFAGVTATQTAMLAFTFNNSTGELRSYQGVNGAGVAFNATADASLHLGQTITDNELSFGGIVNQQYLICASHLLTTLPSDADLITYLDWTYQQAIVGHKVLDSRLIPY